MSIETLLFRLILRVLTHLQDTCSNTTIEPIAISGTKEAKRHLRD